MAEGGLTLDDIAFTYDAPGPVAADFMASDKFVRGLRGPVGSGKTSACCVELFRRAITQVPDKAGLRPTRWLVLRNTQPELKTTTIKSWLDWFPERDWGQDRKSTRLNSSHSGESRMPSSA